MMTDYNTKRKWILNDKPLEEFRRRIKEINNLMSSSIGPSGFSILINNSGHITITKSGIDVISIFDRKISPERDLIVNSMNNLNHDIGDGTKTFAILLSALLLYSENFSRCYLTKQFTMFINLLHTIPNVNDFSCDYHKIVDTFFSTRFPIHISVFLSKLFNEWLEKNTAFNENVFQSLLNSFNTLVSIEEGNPLSESRVQSGLCLKGRFYGKHLPGDEIVRLVVIYLSEEDEGNEDDINSDIRQFSVILQNLHCSNLLIVTNSSLSPASLQVLRSYHTLTHVTNESVHLLYNYVTVNQNKIGVYPEVKAYSLSLSTVFIDVPFYHMLLCAPIKTLSESYILSIKSCLKLCNFVMCNKSLIIECGQFEKLLGNFLLTNFKESANIFSETEQMSSEMHSKKYLLTEEFTEGNMKDKMVAEHFKQIVEDLGSQLQNCLESDVILIIVKVLNEYLIKILPCNNKGYEALSLKVNIFLRSVSTFLTIINIDQVLNVKNVKF